MRVRIGGLDGLRDPERETDQAKERNPRVMNVVAGLDSADDVVSGPDLVPLLADALAATLVD